MSSKVKVGTVTWCDPMSGAFIEDLDEENGNQALEKAFSPMDQVWVPRELLQNMQLTKGQLVRYTEEDHIATRVEPLAPFSAYKTST